MSYSATNRHDLGAAKRIDEICDIFEAAWNTPTPKRIEELLDEVPPQDRGRLFRELLELELDLRNVDPDDERAPEEYRKRFPDEIPIINLVFGASEPLKELGDYELLEELGHGGMGVVYKARQKFLNQIVAVKVLSRSFLEEPQAVARFRREMQMIGSLSHQNIVQAYNAGEANGVHYLVMEYVDGVNPQQLLKRKEQEPDAPLAFPPAAACEVIRQAALGLQHAYENGLVHRDIKPANIMVTRSGVVKLLDLGLGKFHTDRKPPGDPSISLTQIGTTMGTVDYMAPEQWDDPARVDVRADIYSLGCTFYFLMKGNAPFSDSRYDSSRKKLMAHVVAPVPVLSEEVPGCPEKLNRVLAKMMAKEPGDRYQTPGEIVDALEPFADEDKYFAFLDKAIETLDKYGISSDRRTGFGSGSPGPSRRYNSRNTGKRRKSAYWNAESLISWCHLPRIVFGVIIASLLGWFAYSKCGSNSPVNDQSQTVEFAGNIETIRNDLVQLPGLNGQWWFQEMPWYLPFARETLAGNLQESRNPYKFLGGAPQAYLDPNMISVHKWLRERMKETGESFSERQKNLLEDLCQLADAKYERKELAARMQGALARFEKRTPGSPDAKESAADLHSRALLTQRIAGLKSDRKLQENAISLYEEALKSYSLSSSPLAPFLKSVCESDLARLRFAATSDFMEFEKRCTRILEEKDGSELFRVELQITLGANASGAGWYRDRYLLDAKRELEHSEIGTKSHPLAAHLAERYAWSLIDQWKVNEANGQFNYALEIRKTNVRESKDPFAAIYVFHNQHGIAMTERYLGNISDAEAGYAAVVGAVGKAMDEIKLFSGTPGQQRYFSNLRERLSNSRERWADCILYGGKAFENPPDQLSLDNAVKLCALSYDNIEDDGVKIVMACKRAILLALSGKPEEARDILAAHDDRSKKLIGNQKRTLLILDLARAVVLLKTKDTAEQGKSQLRYFLARFRLYPNDPESVRRETLEMQLFAAELLLNEALLQNDIPAARSDLSSLDAIFGSLENRKEMSPFLRRYYELAIRICRGGYDPDSKDNRQLLKIAGYIRRMRTVDSNVMPIAERPTLILFHLSDSPEEGFAIILPQDGHSGRLIDVPLSRKQVKSLVQSKKKAQMPEQLLAFITGENAAKRPIEVSWSDSHCWTKPQEAMNIADWPFENGIVNVQ